MIAIVDYGMGNLASVEKAIRFLGGRSRITSDPRQVAKADAVILPGVGAFGEAMRELKRRRLVSPLTGAVREGKPFLGLCLGLQLLFDSSEEARGVKGLGLLPGRVRRLPRKAGFKVPHMGWNRLRVKGRNPLLRGVPDGAFVYFVHSYYADPENPKFVSAQTDYGRRFPAVVWDGGSVWATQFHPEKSQRWGMRILKNFLKESS